MHRFSITDRFSTVVVTASSHRNAAVGHTALPVIADSFAFDAARHITVFDATTGNTVQMLVTRL